MGNLRLDSVLVAALLVVAATLMTAGPASANPPDDPTLAGANQWSSCHPSESHPRPVILVHGNGAGMNATWVTLAPLLAANGFCVFSLDYGRHEPGSNKNHLDIAGGADIRESAKELSTFADRVRDVTGASQIDIVGHSMGALTARQYLRFEGGADSTDPAKNVVHTLVSVGGGNHGTTFGERKGLRDKAETTGLPADDAISLAVGPAYGQQMTGSSFLQTLNAGGDTMPGVAYVAVATHNDNTITPPESAFLSATNESSVHNVWVQDGCPGLVVDHTGLTATPRAVWLIQTALDSEHSTHRPAPCS